MRSSAARLVRRPLRMAPFACSAPPERPRADATSDLPGAQRPHRAQLDPLGGKRQCLDPATGFLVGLGSPDAHDDAFGAGVKVLDVEGDQLTDAERADEGRRIRTLDPARRAGPPRWQRRCGRRRRCTAAALAGGPCPWCGAGPRGCAACARGRRGWRARRVGAPCRSPWRRAGSWSPSARSSSSPGTRTRAPGQRAWGRGRAPRRRRATPASPVRTR